MKLLMLLVVLVFTQPSSVGSRVLCSASTEKNEIAGSETGDGFEPAGLSSSSYSSNFVKGHVLERNQVFTLASGPSRKGNGHK
ncbi:unnamed protein product [Ilex paraguariensis]|uniref:Secreted protein n=1 Tax=Ilex paraguariensis TaxID=185542 RepID=A0ABC8UXM0_9AQUA